LLWVDTVEKLRITMTRKFIGIFRLPGALTTDQLYRSELRQAGFSCDFCYPLVPTVRNAAQIANKIAAFFKTEFFNRIGQKRTLKGEATPNAGGEQRDEKPEQVNLGAQDDRWL
jgi:hypothetical protein